MEQARSTMIQIIPNLFNSQIATAAEVDEDIDKFERRSSALSLARLFALSRALSLAPSFARALARSIWPARSPVRRRTRV